MKVIQATDISASMLRKGVEVCVVCTGSLWIGSVDGDDKTKVCNLLSCCRHKVCFHKLKWQDEGFNLLFSRRHNVFKKRRFFPSVGLVSKCVGSCTVERSRCRRLDTIWFWITSDLNKYINPMVRRGVFQILNTSSRNSNGKRGAPCLPKNWRLAFFNICHVHSHVASTVGIVSAINIVILICRSCIPYVRLVSRCLYVSETLNLRCWTLLLYVAWLDRSFSLPRKARVIRYIHVEE